MTEQAPKVISFPAIAGKNEKTHSGPTPGDIVLIARDAARQEIMALAKNLATQIQQTIQQSMVPYAKNFSELIQEQNKITILVNAIAGVLIEKKIVTKEELGNMVEHISVKAQQVYQEKVKQEKPKENPEVKDAGAKDADIPK